MSTFTTVNNEAILSVGRTIQWAHQSAHSGAPATAAAGVPLSSPVSAYLSVRLREEIHRRTARVTMTTLDTGATYTVTINGTACNKATPTDEDDLLTGLRDAINSGVGSTVTATALDAGGEDVTSSSQPATSVRIVGDAEADYSIAISATAAGVLACSADASTASGRIYAQPSGSKKSGSTDAVPGWRMVAGGGLLSFDYRGTLERINAAGTERIYCELHTLAGHASDGASVTYTARVDLGQAVVS